MLLVMLPESYSYAHPCLLLKAVEIWRLPKSGVSDNDGYKGPMDAFVQCLSKGI